MKALKINKSGWLWKIARFGGVPKDGLVADKANQKYNRLIRAKYDANEISYKEFTTSMKDPERPIDFCDFTRYCLFALFKSLIVLAFLGLILVFVIAPIIDFLYWAVSGFLNHFWPTLTKSQRLGLVLSMAVPIVSVIMGYIIFIDDVNDFIRRQWYRVFGHRTQEQEYQRAIQKAQSSYQRAELYKAFRDSMKGKACFKMEVID